MSLFHRRKDKQIPKTPVTQDKALQNWLDSVGSLLNKHLFGGGNDRLVTAQELIDSGLASVGNGGFLTNPPKNLTKPPKITGLTANGAFASIFIQWVNPVFSNYGYTELWRSNVDDIGQAVLIASTAVESYVDNVGSAATKYYWARAVSDSGVKGEFNSAQGIKGQTSYDPDYVKQLLTASKWQANTVYAPYQVVQPTTENGYQYMCIDGGQSGDVEPTWPTVVNNTIGDGGIEWRCLTATERLPLVVGQLEDGSPAVFIDTAFIKNASITSAKIGDLVADKITTGDLNANIRILQKLWYGFSEFANPAEQSGFWIGVEGGVPKVKFDTGLSGGNKYFVFDGSQFYMNVDILNSADGYFDDLEGDSVNFAKAFFEKLAFSSLVSASQYTVDNNIKISEPEFDYYLCYPSGCNKSKTWTSGELLIGTGYSRPFAFFQTGIYEGIYPYDYRSNTTKYRASKKKIGFSILVSANDVFNRIVDGVGTDYQNNYMDIYIFSETQTLPSNSYNDSSATTGVPSSYLLKIQAHNHSDGKVTAYKNTGSGDIAVFDVDIFIEKNQVLIKCDDDLEVLDYKVGRTLKVAVVFKAFYQAGGSDDSSIYGTLTAALELQSIASDADVPKNDTPLSLAYIEQPLFTDAQLTYLRNFANNGLDNTD